MRRSRQRPAQTAPADPPRAPGAAPSDTGSEEDLTAPKWNFFNDELVRTGLWTKLTRMPALTAAAAGWAWRANRRDLLIALGASTVAAVLAAVSLVSVTRVLDALLAPGPLADRVGAALPAVAVVAGVAALSGAVRLVSELALARLGPQTERLVELELFGLTTRARLVAFDDEEWADAMYRARDRGVYEVPRMVTATLEGLAGVVSLVSLGGVLAVLHPLLLLLLLVSVVPTGWAATRAARMEYEAQRRLSTGRRRRWILGDRMASRDSAAELRSYTMRDSLMADYGALADRERETMLAVAWSQTRTRAVGGTAAGAATALTYACLGTLLVAGMMPLAAVGTAVLALQRTQGQMQSLLYLLNRVYESGLYFADFTEYCALARVRTPAAPTAPPPARLERLEVRDAVFTYPSGGTPALHGVNVHVEKGETVALVGENGSGKSTLARLLGGLYEPQEGAVTWNGTDFTALGPAVRERISVIIQDHTRWPMTARRNVTMAQGCDPDRLEHAARLSGTDEVVAELPRGWDTLLDTTFASGVNLSGGQWQRVAGARGFYRTADLLIADEPTSALDARAEARFFTTIGEHAARTGAAVVLITHRMASVRMADRIYVLDRGRVIEHGTHAELMAVAGRYRELYTLQADAYSDPGRG
ncbi:ATP-binding cassette, subfamily B/ATP-binding cassette, subfamily C [Nocardiopsis flavescens]|uniref:ATP-binding cassette, subfamily B/ATP-binding cassette, subfamily C n=1 Tax=Nocardiopsis flavescens TaxID=758803 RepID=A0A1M6JP70_9ACTN|nr:ABC transporter ATP-binding protein [Nocardiopsis flavescens]SHJ48517.1 ATP-binding cassette, subfamily B/ATP-binding cassette, subfamily C [Nocardiopsis flavescens]